MGDLSIMVASLVAGLSCVMKRNLLKLLPGALLASNGRVFGLILSLSMLPTINFQSIDLKLIQETCLSSNHQKLLILAKWSRNVPWVKVSITPPAAEREYSGTSRRPQLLHLR